QEWQTMQAYLTSENCLMQFLSHELDDNDAVPCGKCMNCDPANMLPVNFNHNTAVAAAEFLENIFIEIPPKKQAGNAAERFPVYDFPYKFGVLEHMPGRVLCRWGEAGWGEIAKQGKQQRYFDDRLVAASAKLISERWDLEPIPSWITFVPSHRHPELVSDFAKRLAEHLGIRYLDVVKKVKNNPAQKNMENTEFRCANLDGAFEINVDATLDEPVLLIDDAVDSGWTFAVVSALLLRTGTGPVFPFALVSTSTGT
ncbi:MAG: ATP-dependent DNA helicase RecG, partial [Gammaproteobacteria bacterium]